MLYDHQPHEHIEARKSEGPVKLRDEATRFNAKLGLAITVAVGTMWCAYIFAIGAAALVFLTTTADLRSLAAWLVFIVFALCMTGIFILYRHASKGEDENGTWTGPAGNDMSHHD